MMAASFVIFTVARTTRLAEVLVRKEAICRVCITNWAHEPLQAPSHAQAQKRLSARPHAGRISVNAAWPQCPSSEGQAQHATHWGYWLPYAAFPARSAARARGPHHS